MSLLNITSKNKCLSFGLDIFNTYTLKGRLHNDLKRAFIEDMVVNVQLWQEEFNLGRSDLLEEDQAIYDSMKKTVDEASSHAQTLSTIGLLAAPPQPILFSSATGLTTNLGASGIG